MDSREPKKDNVISDQYKIGAYFYDFIVFLLQLFIGGAAQWRNTLIKLVNPSQGDKILELCCGTASVSLRIAKIIKTKVWACDLSEDQIRVARTKARLLRRDVVLTVQDASSTNYKTSNFDKVVISGALHEIKSERRNMIYKELKRLIRAGGRIYISEPDLPANWWGRETFEFMFGKWNREHETAYELIGDGIITELERLGLRQTKSAVSNFGLFNSREFMMGT